MNSRWQKYNDQREEYVQKLHKTLVETEDKLTKTRNQLLDNSNQGISEEQQQHIDQIILQCKRKVEVIEEDKQKVRVYWTQPELHFSGNVNQSYITHTEVKLHGNYLYTSYKKKKKNCYHLVKNGGEFFVSTLFCFVSSWATCKGFGIRMWCVTCVSCYVSGTGHYKQHQFHLVIIL